MCGIISYLGRRPAVPILLEGLKRLEYRGYDSSGLAVFDNGGVQRLRAVGRITALEAEINGHGASARGGIAHTRWATHGKPTIENAHPHSDCEEKVFVVHNGIIENYQSLRKALLSRGHQFHSNTDTEVLAHLIEECMSENLTGSVAEALRRIRGTYAVAIMSILHPNRIVVARRGSPLVLGIGEQELFAASDVSALIKNTRDVIYLEDDDIASLGPGSYEITSLRVPGRLSRQRHSLDWEGEEAGKNGFPHFMFKEIYEQPDVIRRAVRGRLLEAEGTARLGGLESVRERVLNMNRLSIVSCGTSYHAGLLGRYIIESCTNIRVNVDFASEFRYRNLNLTPSDTVLAISQSGETADTLAAVREAKRKGALVLGLVNTAGSSIARETDAGIYNHAGCEVGVASTKCFVSQLTVLYLLALFLGRHQNMSLGEGQEFILELQSIPEKIRKILQGASRIERVARRYTSFRSFLYLGRQYSYPVALEGALKLKEISYIHAEAYAAGEMKHGPIALIDRNVPSVCVMPHDSTYDKMISNIQEIRARSGPVIGVGNRTEDGLCDDFIEVPETMEIFTPMLTAVPLQLLAYYVARQNGCEIDQPRNLAKSVTVE